MPKPPWRNSTRSSRLPKNWRTEIRPAAFERYGNTCHVCGLPGADEIDHLTPGDDHSIENLRPVHGWRTGLPCHKRKSSAEGGRAAQAKRPKRTRDPEPHPGIRR
jgi:5-methylcytosine-specific restriction endonuclease McrA